MGRGLPLKDPLKELLLKDPLKELPLTELLLKDSLKELLFQSRLKKPFDKTSVVLLLKDTRMDLETKGFWPEPG